LAKEWSSVELIPLPTLPHNAAPIERGVTMRMRFLPVLVLSLLGFGCATAGTRHAQFQSIAPTIRTIAVVPFSYEAPFIAGKVDAAGARQIAASIRQSTFIHLQQRQQDGKLTTTLQAMQETDERLSGLPADSPRANAVRFADLAPEAGVDAVLYGLISEYDDPSTGSEVAKSAAGFLVGGLIGSAIQSQGGKITVTYTIYQGRTHEKLWEFTQSQHAGAFKGPEDMLAKFGATVAKQFPFKR